MIIQIILVIIPDENSEWIRSSPRNIFARTETWKKIERDALELGVSVKQESGERYSMVRNGRRRHATQL